MLSREDIIKDNSLKDLDESKIQAIIHLSRVNENYAIGKKVGEIHESYDSATKDVLGLIKPRGKKTYKWLKDEVFPLIKSRLKE